MYQQISHVSTGLIIRDSGEDGERNPFCWRTIRCEAAADRGAEHVLLCHVMQPLLRSYQLAVVCCKEALKVAVQLVKGQKLESVCN